jgi:oligoendopeptidase F
MTAARNRPKTADARTAAAPPPDWNLADLYGGPDDPKVERDLAKGLKDAKAFEAEIKGRVAKLSAADMAKAVRSYEKITERVDTVSSYAQLLYAAHTADNAVAVFAQGVSESATTIYGHLLFFTLEVAKAPAKTVRAWLADPKVRRFEPWLDGVRAYRKHQLSDDLEQKLHELSPVGRAAWSRLFDETLADLRFDVAGKKKPLTLGEALNMMSSKKAAERKAAAKGVAAGLKSRERLFALVTNTLAKSKLIDDGWRDYDRPVSPRNLANQVEDEVVDALVSAVKQSYPQLSHRYYRLKAKWMGGRKLDYWDRNAPLPGDTDKGYTWAQAEQTVLDAYGRFAPEMADIAGTFFEKRWIDAAPRAGKDSGAFSHPVTPKAHPYILMNFHGKARDVMTLAHELGHGVHQVLSNRQGNLMAGTPLTLAETASVFGEMLTFQAILKAETDPQRRRFLLASKVEDMLNTVVRQISFHEFERRVHEDRRAGELSARALGDIWMETSKESLGPALRFDDDYRIFWAYIPHFIHVPFYVYAYAFGDCLVNALYGVFQDGHPGFQGKYLQMLKAGGTLRHKALLAPFGLDASDPAFWSRGLAVIEGFVDELERLDKHGV